MPDRNIINEKLKVIYESICMVEARFFKKLMIQNELDLRKEISEL
ncbi:Uncharacterized protein dnl_14560 [Desulfonema limicola]|uniref:Uncharacterized protein n=1 Tax=Desulfonema limicola TaxID=45656 RepID=A0A975B5L0_9BACT|nr:hypothetical protein [Desulfonema limicola]QTA79202.1 Uncharacterized protein dnl_14560 [Desulfonema limicola]